jgi:hypothetical protein
MIKNIYDVIKDIFKSASEAGLDDITWEELKDNVLEQKVSHTWMYENADGYGIDPHSSEVETIHGICDDGEDEYSETIFRKDGTAYIVNLDETFIWNQQLYDATH